MQCFSTGVSRHFEFRCVYVQSVVILAIPCLVQFYHPIGFACRFFVKLLPLSLHLLHTEFYYNTYF
jgi:hypothetical protein